MNNIKSILSFRKQGVYKKAQTLLFSALVLITPLLFTPKTKEAFEFPKMMFVYFVGSTIIWLFSIKKIANKEKIRLPSLWVLAFLGIYVISTIFSSHFYTSVFGYYTRFNGGLISVLIFGGLYTVLINDFNKNDIKNFLKLSCLTLLPVAIFAVYQHSNNEVRVYSTLGQPNWLAAYILILLPITLKQTLENEFSKKIGWGLIFLTGFFGLWVTYSISGFLALIISVIVFALLNWKLIKQNKIWMGIIFSLALFIAVTNPGIFSQKINDVFIDLEKIYQNNFVVEAQKENLQNSISDPGYIRLNLWKGTLNLTTNSFKNFILGTGPETFPYAFQKFRPKQLNYSSEWKIIFNKPHNYYLELFSNLGIFGLITFLMVVRNFFKNKNNQLIPSMTAFLVVILFGWPTVVISLLFWIILAHNSKEIL